MWRRLPCSATSGPSSLIRSAGFLYLYALHKAARWLPWKTRLWAVSPSLIQHLCMLSILSLHLPALRSERINPQRCVAELERIVLYYSVMQGVIAALCPHADEVVHTQAALCLGWYVWHRTHREWLPSPELMRCTLILYFLACVPLLWVQITPQSSAPAAVCHCIAACLCDLTWVGFECIQRVYTRLGELATRP